LRQAPAAKGADPELFGSLCGVEKKNFILKPKFTSYGKEE